jgi:hypothetical protein
LTLPVLAFAALLAPSSTEAALDRAFNRLYNFDFPGAHAILDRHIQSDPDDPLLHGVKAAAYLYSELARLHILEADFFLDNDKLVDRRKLVPDPAVRDAFRASIATTERLAAAHPGRDSLFAQSMAAGLVMDYAALVERRRFGSFPLAKRTQAFALKLLAMDPPVYDAYLTTGTIEYVVGNIPFIFRWLVRIDQIKGNRRKGMADLELVARHGRYYGPLARVMLAVINLREKRPAQAREILAALVADYPENPLFRKELARLAKPAPRRR